MTSVFLCYASEDRVAAEQVHLALTSAGYKVFYDEQSLPPGGDYQARIQRAIRRCDLFVFLVSTSSIAPDKFTRTELKFVRERWQSPVGRVLAVNLQRLPVSAVPPYLTAATMLTAEGNLAAEVRAAAEAMRPALDRGKLGRPALVVATLAAAVFVGGVVSRNLTRGQPMGPLEQGWNYHQNDIDPNAWRLVRSAEECSDLCYQREECKAMTYVRSNNTCWLKKAVPARTPNSDMVSAVKRLPTR